MRHFGVGREPGWEGPALFCVVGSQSVGDVRAVFVVWVVPLVAERDGAAEAVQPRAQGIGDGG